MKFNLSYSPAAASLTGLLSNATGATWTLTATAAGDSLAHLITVRNDSITDHSAKTALLTGTDADGDTLTETINLPAGSATVTSTKYFKTLTTIVPSATIGADTMDIGWAAGCITPTIPLDYRSPYACAIMCDISGTITFSGEETFEDVQGSTSPAEGVTWSTMTGISAKTADTTSSTTIGARAFRVKVTAITSTPTLDVFGVQAGN